MAPTRPITTWIALIAELSLDRAQRLIKPLEIPTNNPAGFSAALQLLSPDPDMAASWIGDLLPRLQKQLTVGIGQQEAVSVLRWLEAFPCDGDNILPSHWFWRRHFMTADPHLPPTGVDSSSWRLSVAMMRGLALPAPMSSDNEEIISRYLRLRDKLSLALGALDSARGGAYTPYDLRLYLVFGWNDHGTNEALGIIERGVDNFGIAATWRLLAPLFDAASQRLIEEWAFRADVDAQQSGLTDITSFAADAATVGVTVEEFVAAIFPPVAPAPKLSNLLSSREQ